MQKKLYFIYSLLALAFCVSTAYFIPLFSDQTAWAISNHDLNSYHDSSDDTARCLAEAVLGFGLFIFFFFIGLLKKDK